MSLDARLLFLSFGITFVVAMAAVALCLIIVRILSVFIPIQSAASASLIVALGVLFFSMYQNLQTHFESRSQNLGLLSTLSRLVGEGLVMITASGPDANAAVSSGDLYKRREYIRQLKIMLEGLDASRVSSPRATLALAEARAGLATAVEQINKAQPTDALDFDLAAYYLARANMLLEQEREIQCPRPWQLGGFSVTLGPGCVY